MLKGGILNPEIAHTLACLGHKDTLIICDAGLPVPKGVKRIDLAWKSGEPGYIEVLEEMLKHVCVEEAILANELKSVSPKMHEHILKTLDGIDVKYVEHKELKERSANAAAIIRTGEFTPYPSVILVCGCAY